MEDSPIVRDRGRTRKTLSQTIQRDLNLNCLSLDMIHDKTLYHHLIYVADLI